MASLSPYTGVLGLRKAKHLLRRATFNYSKTTLDSLANMNAVDAVNSIATNPANVLAEPIDPFASDDGLWTSSPELPNSFSGQTRKKAFVTAWWWFNAINQTSIKHKLSFFLHTSFTVAKDNGAGASTYYFDHLRLLDHYAMGNIKTLAKKITLDNSMLDYLDNTSNQASNPNENYAREFLELFTILKGPQIGDEDYTNYTEIDVQQAAKVFTGFRKLNDRSLIDPDTNIPKGYNHLNRHDTNDKTFSHAFDNQIITGQNTEAGMDQELDDFVEMIFAKEATAISYCRKLYRFFVKSEWDSTIENDIILPLAQQLMANNYEILPVVTTLLSSQHFFDEDTSDNTDEIIGAIVKSPLQLVNEVCTLFGLQIPDPSTETQNYFHNFFKKFVHDSFLGGSGLPFFSPDTVAGYPAYYQEPDFDRHWFSSSTIIPRYKLMESFISGRDSIFPNSSIRTQLNTVAAVENLISDPSNIHTIVDELADLMYPEAIDADRKLYFVELALDGYPDYYWTTSWNDYLSDNNDAIVKNRLDALFTAMVNAAEFQLM